MGLVSTSRLFIARYIMEKIQKKQKSLEPNLYIIDVRHFY